MLLGPTADFINYPDRLFFSHYIHMFSHVWVVETFLVNLLPHYLYVQFPHLRKPIS